MKTHLLTREQIIPQALETVFPFFADARNLEHLTPPWLHFQILTPGPIVMQTGTLIDYTIRWRWLPVRWRTEILDWSPPHQFVDQQIRGPYQLWHHTHTFEAVPEGTLMRDIVRYAIPFGPIGWLARQLIVAQDLERIFDYRWERIEERFGKSPPRSGLVPAGKTPAHVTGRPTVPA